MAVNKNGIKLPISMAVEPEGFGERDFFAEIDNEQANDEIEQLSNGSISNKMYK